jgi:hypothetical protein
LRLADRVRTVGLHSADHGGNGHRDDRSGGGCVWFGGPGGGAFRFGGDHDGRFWFGGPDGGCVWFGGPDHGGPDHGGLRFRGAHDGRVRFSGPDHLGTGDAVPERVGFGQCPGGGG